MSTFFLLAALLLLLMIAFGMLRILRGPTPDDRMLAAQLFGTTGVAILLLLGQAMAQPALTDIALVFALLSAVASVAFVRQRRLPDDPTRHPDDGGA
jgi:multicomponent Na+:H+ antiporter subunit F